MKSGSLLITGGAGFVGSNLALRFAAEGWAVTALDNLKRRGSELQLGTLRQAGVTFFHGDVRERSDLEHLGKHDLIIDASAEPSVHAGTDNPDYLIQTNLGGTLNLLEWARHHEVAFLFLSTSRVFSIEALNTLPFEEEESRFRWVPAEIQGYSENGIAEDFSREGARSLYGTSKLCSELFIEEYAKQYGLKALVNRCGILTGPRQMGKIDQGVVALWIARHLYEKPLTYTGFGGKGKQVRDLLHIDDLFDLLILQLARPELWTGKPFQVGGGQDNSVSLKELTQLCREITGHSMEISGRSETSPLDLRCYITDGSIVQSRFKWKPRRCPSTIVEDICRWIRNDLDNLRPLFT